MILTFADILILNFMKKLKMQKEKFAKKEKYNVSSRSIQHDDIKRMVRYQQNLINTLLYQKKEIQTQSKKNNWQEVKNKITAEIKSIENFIQQYYLTSYQPIKL